MTGERDVAAPCEPSFTFTSDGLDPTEIVVRIDSASDRSTTMSITARFRSDEAMRHALNIGFVDGVGRSCRAAHGVVDAA